MLITHTKTQLLADFSFLLQTMEEVHPDLYSDVDKSQWDNEVERIKAELEDGMTSLDFIKVVGKLVASIGDGHTYILPWIDEITKNEEFKYFPLSMNFAKERTLNNYDMGIIRAGDEILEVNEIPMTQLVQEMVQYISAETADFKYAMLARRFTILLTALYGIEDVYTLKVRRKKEIIETSVTGMTGAELNEWAKTLPQKKNDGNNFKIEDDIGILTIPSFGMYKEDADTYREFIDDVFLQLKDQKSKRLIIDVRNNGGGDSRLAKYITNYLTEEPTYNFDRLIWKSSKQIREFVRDDVENGTHGYYSQSGLDKLLSVNEGECIEQDCKSSVNPNEHKENTFQGDVIALSNPLCFSTTTDLLAMIRDFKLGRIVGTCSGGLPNSFGDCYYFNLPNTNIFCSVSHKFFVRPSGNEKDNDLTPDYIIEQSAEDKQKNFDTVLEFAKLC